MATVWPYINEGLMLISAGTALAGWYSIRRKRVEEHRRRMLAASAFGAAFFVSYLLRSLVEGDTTFGGPQAWRPLYLAFLQFHVLLALAAGILGITALRRGLARRFAQHRRVAPWAATLWLLAAATGLVVFLLLYVVFPPGPTRSPWEALTR